MSQLPEKPATSREIAAFLSKSQNLSLFAKKIPRLLFALDATASRQHTWDVACQLQGQMFTVANGFSALSMQLAYYRGAGDFFASQWSQDSNTLAGIMAEVHCRAGHTQLARVLQHGLDEHAALAIRALVFVGDSVEESHAELARLAAECGLRGLPLFLFQEGDNRDVTALWQEMARLSKGAWARFEASADQLKSLLTAVARYASGGLKALMSQTDEGAKLMLQQLKQ